MEKVIREEQIIAHVSLATVFVTQMTAMMKQESVSLAFTIPLVMLVICFHLLQLGHLASFCSFVDAVVKY